MVGERDAAGYGKRLERRLGISSDLANVLVAEANENVFRPLQRYAFSHHEEEEITRDPRVPEEELLEEDELIDHEKISNLMQDHGIELVDEEDLPRPHNDLQKMADELFSDSLEQDTPSGNGFERQEGGEVDSLEPVNYHPEVIEEKDLLGVHAHRTDTSILENATSYQEKKASIEDYAREKDLLTHMHISQIETFDHSPTHEEQIVERGEYLEHISKK